MPGFISWPEKEGKVSPHTQPRRIKTHKVLTAGPKNIYKSIGIYASLFIEPAKNYIMTPGWV